MTHAKKIVIIAGPNGAGKTTFAREFLPLEAACPVFINADLIAAGLSPFQPEVAAFRAGRIMLQEIGNHVARGNSFAFETTLSGLTYARMIPAWQAAGYRVELMFLALNNEDEAIARVATRVRQGGHSIPPDVIRRRFVGGLRNFQSTYRALVDAWQWFDNSRRAPAIGRSRSQPMSDSMPSNLQDSDMQGSYQALLRAALRARDVARQTNTPLVLMRSGVLVEEDVNSETAIADEQHIRALLQADV